MRRALLVCLIAAPAHAGPAVTAEAGGEYDSNVQRVETGPGLMTAPIAAGVVRFGLRGEAKGRLLGGGYVADVSNLTRIVDDPMLAVENISVFGGDLRWLHPLGDRPVLGGVALTAADAFPVGDPTGSRTFSNLGADGVLLLGTGDDHHLLLAAGGRQFVFKPDHSYDWAGPTANARLDLLLWQSAAKTKTLELVTLASFEARAYDVPALVNACPPNQRPDPSCSTGTSLLRRDRYSRAGVDLTWVGSLVAAIGYQLTVIDSNSYGQSFVRHRATASATVAFGKTYLTALANLQIDNYLDGLIVQQDVQHVEFTNIEDENRSSLQLRLARSLSKSVSLEGRAAVWRNIASGDLAFERELVYAGIIYAH